MTAHEALCGVLDILDHSDKWVQQPDIKSLDGPGWCLFQATYSATKPNTMERFQAHNEAVEALAEVIGCEPDPVVIGEWNDHPDRTFDEVRTVVIAAIWLTAPMPDLDLEYVGG